MIVLGKDKVDERFNISDDGIIIDLQGNVQETYLNQGRPLFKGISVHRILMYTKFGYKDLDIHHLDENKLNNNINNLQYLTREEHTSLHKKGKSGPNKGGHLSEETKKKMSAAHKGKKLAWAGKKHWKKDPITGKRIWY